MAEGGLILKVHPDEIFDAALQGAAQKYIDKEKLWVNPDCGLKTRGWPEVKQSLKSMVSVAKSLR